MPRFLVSLQFGGPADPVPAVSCEGPGVFASPATETGPSHPSSRDGSFACSRLAATASRRIAGSAEGIQGWGREERQPTESCRGRMQRRGAGPEKEQTVSERLGKRFAQRTFEKLPKEIAGQEVSPAILVARLLGLRSNRSEGCCAATRCGLSSAQKKAIAHRLGIKAGTQSLLQEGAPRKPCRHESNKVRASMTAEWFGCLPEQFAAALQRVIFSKRPLAMGWSATAWLRCPAGGAKRGPAWRRRVSGKPAIPWSAAA